LIIAATDLGTNKAVKTHKNVGSIPFVLIALLLGLIFGNSAGCREKTPAPPKGIHTEGRWIKDEKGRVILLRGMNLSNKAKSPPFHPLRDDQEAELDRLKAWGFNSLRYLIIWEAIEPAPGVYNQYYLSKLDEWVDRATSRGFYLVLDMHQDIYSRVFCGDGAPEWAALTYLPGPDCSETWYLNYFSPAVQASFDNLWTNDLLQDHYIKAFQEVARRYKDNPLVIGYDIINEPHPGSLPLNGPDFEQERLEPFYKKLIPALRNVHPGCLIFFEPSIVVGGGLKTYLGKMPFSNLVFAPHYYDPMVMWVNPYDGKRTRAMAAFDLLEKESREQLGDIPWWVGEWGILASTTNSLGYMKDQAELMDEFLAGWADWDYNILEDDLMSPISPIGEERFLTDALGLTSSTTLLDVLSRPYPMKTAGVPKLLSFDINTREFSFEFDENLDTEGPTEIFVPEIRHYPIGFTVSTNDGFYSYEKASGVLSYFPDRSQDSHKVTIRR